MTLFEVTTVPEYLVYKYNIPAKIINHGYLLADGDFCSVESFIIRGGDIYYNSYRNAIRVLKRHYPNVKQIKSNLVNYTAVWKLENE